MEYCSESDVRNRLTDSGYESMIDRDRSGGVTANEIAKYVTPSIQRAGNEIDFAMAAKCTADYARSQQNAFLRMIAVDIACYYVCTIGGGGVPDSIQASLDYARELLKQIRSNGAIPGFTYLPQPSGVPAYQSLDPDYINY